MSFTARIMAELEQAIAARAAGNEGRARVCARRAAGMAAREFLTRREVRTLIAGQSATHSSSAYEALQSLAVFPGLAPDLKEAAIRLTLRVNGEFGIPPGMDLIIEAKKLIGGLE
jgi:hypothetical protein